MSDVAGERVDAAAIRRRLTDRRADEFVPDSSWAECC
jgi:hypothetical protein